METLLNSQRMAKFIPISLRVKNNEKREGRKAAEKKEKQTKNLRNKNENKGTQEKLWKERKMGVGVENENKPRL